MAHGECGVAAAAWPRRPTRGYARRTYPFAPRLRVRKHVAVAAAATCNMMHSACKVLLDQQHFPMGMSTFTPMWSPRSVRSVPRTAWATCGRAGNMMASPWASAPPVPPPGRPDHGHGPRTSTRSRLRSATAAHGGSGPTFAFSTRSRAPITVSYTHLTLPTN